jgi:quercetin dioxygenase-like cupin family protein
MIFWQTPAAPANQVKITAVSRDTTTDAGEPIRYLSTPNPEVSSMILELPPGGKTDWMTHPVPGYLYVLEGELTVEFTDGSHLVFHAGQGFLQARTKWHRGVNNGSSTMRFLAVFFGEKGTPVLLNPPKGPAVSGETNSRH